MSNPTKKQEWPWQANNIVIPRDVFANLQKKGLFILTKTQKESRKMWQLIFSGGLFGCRPH